MLLLYYLDKLAHKLGYSPTDYDEDARRRWRYPAFRYGWCIRAEDQLMEIALAHKFERGAGSKSRFPPPCRCFWCRRYEGPG